MTPLKPPMMTSKARKDMAQQLIFDLPTKTARTRDDFFISPANAVAVKMIEDWAVWPLNKLLLCGPSGAGKTHLAYVWAGDVGAEVISADDLPTHDIDVLSQSPVVIEDIPQIAENATAQEALFHLHNLMQDMGAPLLLTSATAPNHIKFTLPDLQSRLNGTALIDLSPPDDALLSAVLVKLFSDRQINVQPTLISYLTKRMHRSFDAANRLVATLDDAALTQRRPITQSLAARVLDKLGADAP